MESAAKAKGLTIFARIDHAAGATSVGLPLRPTELLIFGNARGGTPLMQLAQTIGIDLPLKMLAWEDAAGKTWLSYNDPAWLAARHGIAEQGAAVAKTLGNATRGTRAGSDRRVNATFDAAVRRLSKSRSALFVAGPGAHNAIAAAEIITAAERLVLGFAEV